ncbi:MAG: heavy metal translocating P-type ATPase, partial [Bacteroidales bacterium]|nr:heavy metal translocating P-type ATPase [Bacteroidales bacterium]
MAHEHHHHHEHHHDEDSPKERLVKIAAATVLLVVAVLVEKRTDWAAWQYLLLYLVPYLIVGWDTLKEAAEALAHGEALDENFL